MPAYNEADGIEGFLDELATATATLAERRSIVVVDDSSSDDTVEVVRGLAERIPGLRVVAEPVNRGHGPTALAAYREGLALDPDLLVHVDGDGQISGTDVARLVRVLAESNAGADAGPPAVPDSDAGLETGASPDAAPAGSIPAGVDVVHGARVNRREPWFRRAITATLRFALLVTLGVRVADVNTPFRAYRPDTLRALLQATPDDATVPHVHFSIFERRLGIRVANLAVHSLPRRGTSPTGTMWRESSARRRIRLPPPRLRAFVRRAAAEVWRTHFVGRGRWGRRRMAS